MPSPNPNPTRTHTPSFILHPSPQNISHLEIEDPDLCADVSRWDTLLETLLLLPALRALSLPNTVHVNLHANALHELTQTLRGLSGLRKLNLASCNLKDCLDQLLQGLEQGVVYLSLRDCRLTKVDVQALLEVSLGLWASGVRRMKGEFYCCCCCC